MVSSSINVCSMVMTVTTRMSCQMSKFRINFCLLDICTGYTVTALEPLIILYLICFYQEQTNVSAVSGDTGVGSDQDVEKGRVISLPQCKF